MKTDKIQSHRIATIGRDSYILPEGFSNEDSLRLFNFLSGCRKIDDSGNYIPDAESRYSTQALVIIDDPLEVAFKITAKPLLTREEFNKAREAGEAAYKKAHPEERAA